MIRFLLICFIVLCQNTSHALEEVLFPLVMPYKNIQISKLLDGAEKLRLNSIGWCSKTKSEGIIALILNTKPKICVEVGVFGGSSFFSTAITLKYLKNGIIYGIDSWNNADCIRFMPVEDLNRDWWGKVDLLSVYNSFITTLNTQNLKKFCVVYREESVKAALRFENDSIDILHWDGNHSFIGAQREIRAYLPKVKSGGYILVSDVMWGVADNNPILIAVEELFKCCDLIDTLEDDNVFLFKKL